MGEELRFLPLMVTSCISVAALPVVGPRIRVLSGTFNVPALPNMIVLAEAGSLAPKRAASKVTSAPEVAAAAAASASRRLHGDLLPLLQLAAIPVLSSRLVLTT